MHGVFVTAGGSIRFAGGDGIGGVFGRSVIAVNAAAHAAAGAAHAAHFAAAQHNAVRGAIGVQGQGNGIAHCNVIGGQGLLGIVRGTLAVLRHLRGTAIAAAVGVSRYVAICRGVPISGGIAAVAIGLLRRVALGCAAGIRTTVGGLGRTAGIRARCIAVCIAALGLAVCIAAVAVRLFLRGTAVVAAAGIAAGHLRGLAVTTRCAAHAAGATAGNGGAVIDRGGHAVAAVGRNRNGTAADGRYRTGIARLRRCVGSGSCAAGIGGSICGGGIAGSRTASHGINHAHGQQSAKNTFFHKYHS